MASGIEFESNMLQFNRPKSELKREPLAAEMLSGAETLQSSRKLCPSAIRRHLFVTLLTTALGVIYLFTTRPSFTAASSVDD